MPEIAPLAFPFEHNRFRHELVERQGDVCLVRRLNLEVDPPSAHWEVVILQRRRAETLPSGRSYPAREAYPGDAEWGTHGWTFVIEALARAKWAEITLRSSGAAPQSPG